jgi:membrane protein required for colicin V production
MIFDLICVLVFIYAITKGYSKGLIGALFSLIGNLMGVVLAVLFSGNLSEWLQEAGNYQVKWLPALVFILILISVNLVARILSRIVESGAELVMLGWLNKLGGIVLFLFIGVLIMSTILYVTHIFLPAALASLNESYFYRFTEPIIPSLFNLIAKYWPSFKHALTSLTS